jgi:hydroxymethylpyrimidine pyrophosphatase-like HAD family hydrolase
MDEGNANVLLGASMISALANVDGTLVTKAKILTKRAIEAVHTLHQNGIAFFITSGRLPRGMRMLVQPLGPQMPMAAFNGVMLVHPDREAATVQSRPNVVPTFDGLLNRVVKIVGVSDDLDSVLSCHGPLCFRINLEEPGKD